MGLSHYRIEVRPSALRSLRKLDPQIARRIHGAITLLADNPRPPNARQLKGRDALRVRIGDYRVIYTIKDDVLTIVVIALRHRRDIYER